MIEPAEVRARRVVKADLGAVVGVRAPRGVVQKARGLHEAQPLGRRTLVDRREEGEELLAEPRQPGGGELGKAGGLQKRIAGAQPLGHLLVEQALADAVGGNVDLPRLEGQDQLAQHLAGEGDEVHAVRRGAGARAQDRGVVGADPVQRVEQRLRHHAVFVQHGERVVAPFHVEPGDGAPRAADEVDAVAVGLDAVLERPDDALDDRAALLGAPLDLLQAEGAERRGHPPTHLAAADAGEFHRRAADVAHDPLGVGPAQQHALRRQPRLLVAVDDVELEAGLRLHFGLERRAVGRLAHRGGRDAGERGGAHVLGQQGEAAQRHHRARLAAGVEEAGLGQPLAQARHQLLVVEVGGRAGGAVEHHHAHRVGAHVHDPHPRQRAHRRVVEQGPAEGAPLVARGRLGWLACHGVAHRRPRPFARSTGAMPPRRRILSRRRLSPARRPSHGQAAGHPWPPPCRAPRATGSP